MNFLSYISSIITVSKSLEDEINVRFKKTVILKGKALVDENEQCSDLFFIETGLLRGFYFDDGKEITNWFAQEGEFASCAYSFISNMRSNESIQALEDSNLRQIPRASLHELYIQFPETERVGRMIIENYYMKLEERLLNIQFKTAKERYRNLFLTKSSLLQRASLGHIASYLGITQETLSRIRAEM